MNYYALWDISEMRFKKRFSLNRILAVSCYFALIFLRKNSKHFVSNFVQIVTYKGFYCHDIYYVYVILINLIEA